MDGCTSQDYLKIEKAISYLRKHFEKRPGLDEVSKHIGLSKSHFQKIFTKWAGVSPKKFQQYISIEYAKNLIHKNNLPLLDIAIKSAMSGNGNIHDLHIKMERMTPDEYKNQGENLSFNYSLVETIFGSLFVVSSKRGITYMGFEKNIAKGLKHIKNTFPNATYLNESDSIQENALLLFNRDWTNIKEIKLYLKGTNFQFKVWETLITIPFGELRTYGDIAQLVNTPKAFQAVGTAIGKNPVSFIIPCHRVIKNTGESGEYMWGSSRKLLMIGWEGAILNE